MDRQYTNELTPGQGEGLKICLENGHWASVLIEGGIVTYSDGRTAKIIRRAGSEHSLEDKGIALVSSLLDNGDEIISPPQNSFVLVGREGVAMPLDFLSIVGEA